jgi:hypothetical protein
MKKFNYKDNSFAILGVLFLIVYGLIKLIQINEYIKHIKNMNP